MQASSIPMALGVGQTWQDKTAERALSVNYTNTTGRTIGVAISTFYNVDTGGVNIYVNGKLVTSNGHNAHAYSFGREGACLIPPNAEYRVESSKGVSMWWELR